ncbi:MAG: FAD:protein FMN transferase [Deltaproteobacteria bacterium]|nr:FAD:protein FMN transferase [Deltaproteobacteria bacterium]
MTSAADPPRRSGFSLSGRARVLLPLMLMLLLAASIHRLACAPPPLAQAEFVGESMGTSWSVKLAVVDLDAAERAEVKRTIEFELRAVDEAMSTWRLDSELSRFNAHGSTEPFPVSNELLAVFRIASEVSELSGGAFDVTVGPVVAAWGFGATDRIPAPPPPEELEQLRERVGYRLVEVQAGALRKSRGDVVCDLSAIAKGFAVDRVAEALSELGYRDYLVEVGGEIRARGQRRGGGFWRVAIERPDAGARDAFDVLPLRDVALATSGDYRNFYQSGGRRYSHTIDPRTARPIEHALASVSVLHRDAVYADALATALNVLGSEAGYSLAEREGLAALFIVREADAAFSARATPAFEAARAGAATAPDAPPSDR